MEIKNFKIVEFFSHCNEFEIMDAIVDLDICRNIYRLMEVLQLMRDYLDSWIVITSCYRDKEHNKRVDGSSTSQHLTASAVDIQVRSDKYFDVLTYIVGTNKCEIENNYKRSFGQVIVYYDEKEEIRFIHIGLPCSKYPQLSLFKHLPNRGYIPYEF